MSAQRLCRTALMTALLCAAAPLTLPVGPVPVSLATLAVGMAGALLGVRGGLTSVLLYLLLGALGLPVYAGFASGPAHLAGPTGGFLAGYLILAAACGFAAQRWGVGGWRFPAAMAAGTLMCGAVGAAWFARCSGLPFAAAWTSCAMPFLPGDAVKILAATAASRRLSRAARFARLRSGPRAEGGAV